MFTQLVMFRHNHQVKSIHTSNYKWLQSHSCRLCDAPVVTINRQCIELKGLSQIVLGGRTSIASKNRHFCHFELSMARPKPIPRVPRCIPQALRAPSCQRGFSHFSRGYYQTVNLLTMRDGKALPSASRLPGGLRMIYLANFQFKHVSNHYPAAEGHCRLLDRRGPMTERCTYLSTGPCKNGGCTRSAVR